MKHFLLLNILLFPLLLFGKLAPPKLSVDQPEFDFGDARTGTVLEHTFTLQNQGQSLLRIQNIRTSCGCTASELSTREIPAGGSATLSVTLDLTGRSGPQSEQIRIQSNDPTTPNSVLTLKAHAIPRVEVVPRTLNFQQVSPGASPTGQITIRATTDTPLRIKEIRSVHSRVETDLKEIHPEREYQLSVRPLDLIGTGHFTERLEIVTDDPELSSIPVLVMWQIAEAVSVAPRQLNLIASTQPTTRFLMIRGAQDLDPPLEVTSVTWPQRDIEIKVGPAGPFGTRVEFELVPVKEMNGEHILIQTNVPGFEEITLPIRVIQP